MTLMPTISPAWTRDFVRLADDNDVEWIGRLDARYETARLIYNRYHDLHPAALVRTCDARVVGEIVKFAADHGVPLAIRGGGHHIAGYGSCEDGIVLDFSPFRGVRLDPSRCEVEVEPGTLLRDLDRYLNPGGLVVPTGTVSKTGIAGLALGGGIGWLVGRYGLTCDHLIGADVVLANGRQVQAENPDHADLLWALRGGGGNFGVVTRFRFRTRPLSTFVAGSAVIAMDRAAEALEATVQFIGNQCPPDLTLAPTLIRTASGTSVLSIDYCLMGGSRKTLRLLKHAVGPARWVVRCRDDYPKWQSTFDSSFEPPMRGYWKAKYSTQLTRPEIDTLLEAFDQAATDRSAILIEHLHGAFTATGSDTAAFPLRWARFGTLFSARWQHPSEDADAIAWVRDSFARLDPTLTSGSYSNYTSHDDPRAVSVVEHGLAARLLKVKREYDPNNLFRRNHNISVTELESQN